MTHNNWSHECHASSFDYSSFVATVHDKKNEMYEDQWSDNWWWINLLKCVLFQCNMIKFLLFLNIDKNSIPIFVKTFSAKVCDTWVRKNQVSVCFILTLTEYKALDSTYLKTVLRLVRRKIHKSNTSLSMFSWLAWD